MGNKGRDWKSALQKHLNSLVREAWLDYQSSPPLRKAWASKAYEYSEASERERAVREAIIEPPDQNQFNYELCIDLGFLLCDALFYRDDIPLSDASKSLLDVLATIFSLIPGVYDRRSLDAKRFLPSILEQYSTHWARLGYDPSQLEVLLTASTLREGYFRPLLSIWGIAFASLEGETRTICRQYNTDNVIGPNVGALVSRAHVSPPYLDYLAQLATDIGSEISATNFDGHDVKAAAAEVEMIIRDITTALAQPTETGPAIAAPFTPRLDDNLAEIISELTSMVGLDAVKREVISLANFIKVRRLREARNLRQQTISLHLVFSGSPGTGKTTIARLVAKLYKALGVLSKGQLVETDRGGLVAGYVGHTALKTKEVVESALDGVLFVDEAYSLTKEAPWDFGAEAIETLLKLMEDYRDRLVVIVAGYTDKMAEFIGSNPGLQSRFTRRIEFQDYTASEMLQIFERNATSNNFELDPKATTALLDHFRRFEGDGGFGNGRGVRNVFEAAVVAHANRIAAIADPTDRDLTLLLREDAVGIGDDEARTPEDDALPAIFTMRKTGA